MGIVYLKVKIANPAKPSSWVEHDFLVDSGAIYSVVPRQVLKKLGIHPHSTMEFTLADGKKIKRETGDALFEYQGRRGASTVIFGEKRDSSLLGIVTLEELALMIDPLTRDLRQLPLIIKHQAKNQ